MPSLPSCTLPVHVAPFLLMVPMSLMVHPGCEQSETVMVLRLMNPHKQVGHACCHYSPLSLHPSIHPAIFLSFAFTRRAESRATPPWVQSCCLSRLRSPAVWQLFRLHGAKRLTGLSFQVRRLWSRHLLSRLSFHFPTSGETGYLSVSTLCSKQICLPNKIWCLLNSFCPY